MFNYCEDHSSIISPQLRAIRTDTSQIPRAHMMLPVSLVTLVAIIVKLCKPRHCLEIGAFTGFATAAIAEALSDDAELISLEDDQKHFQILERNIRRLRAAGQRVSLIQQEGFHWLADKDMTFDFVLLDARKQLYAQHYQCLIDHLSVGGVLIVDNVFCNGGVLAPSRDFERSIAEFNLLLAKDPRMCVAMLAVRDGFTIAQKTE